jgi:hypothetical protein
MFCFTNFVNHNCLLYTLKKEILKTIPNINANKSKKNYNNGY